MARIKLSPLIASINGKVGMSVFQDGKSGTILRQKAIPRNRNTASQVYKRSILNVVKSKWQNLSTAQKNSWIALTNFMQKKQKKNATKVLTPYELFVQYNFIRVQADTAELLLTTLETDVIFDFYIEVDTLTSVLFKLYLETQSQNLNAYTSVYISKAVRSSSALPKSSVRYIFSYFEIGNTFDLTTEYINLFGTLPEAGQKVLMKFVAFSPNSGWLSKVVYKELTF